MNNKQIVQKMQFLILIMFLLSFSCDLWHGDSGIEPIRVSDPVQHDSDDPAIWVNSADPSQSMILGTDKDTDGALYVFDIEGNEIVEKRVSGLNYPNNVDVEYGFSLDGNDIDIAVVTERGEERLRIYKVPDMIPIDGGIGIPVFVGETDRRCMGIGLFKRPSDGLIYAIVSRKDGSSGTYLWQYRLQDNGSGQIEGIHVRSFGEFSGIKEIESVAVDDELGFVYYSDERAGIRKYHADPDHPDAAEQLAFFGINDFRGDMEGISIYDLGSGKGYLIISDQEGNSFNIFPREGSQIDVHNHELIKSIRVESERSDGNEVTSTEISALYTGGLFVAMSENRRFHYYSWEQLAKAPKEELLVR